MVDEGRRRWRWSNVPIPEPHVVSLIAGTVAHLLRPWRAPEMGRPTRVTGAALLGVGVVIVSWAVRTFGESDVEAPTGLVQSGPYEFSRNPMYVGWTLIYVGIALLAKTTWLFLGIPVVVGATHELVRREERTLERTFGEEYRVYRRDVRRYI